MLRPETNDWGLFELAAGHQLVAGDKVVVSTIWGDESGVVVTREKASGFPMLTCDLEMGDRVTVNAARVRPA